MKKISYSYKDKRTYLALPYFGEFGWFILSHVPQVNEFSKINPTTVACRKGQEFLFPFAKSFLYDYDTLKVNSDFLNKKHQEHEYSKLSRHLYVQSQFKDTFATRRKKDIYTKAPIYINDINKYKIDISIGARDRDWEAFRNYSHWQSIINFCKSQGLSVGICGIRGGTMNLKNIDMYSYDLENTTRGCAEMMNNAKMVINLDSGLMHLAALLEIKQYAIRAWPEKNTKRNRTYNQGVKLSNGNVNEVPYAAYQNASIVIQRIKQEFKL